jgi:hypothetical protein
MLDKSLVNSDSVYRLQHRDQRGSTKLLSQVCNQGVTYALSLGLLVGKQIPNCLWKNMRLAKNPPRLQALLYAKRVKYGKIWEF